MRRAFLKRAAAVAVARAEPLMAGARSGARNRRWAGDAEARQRRRGPDAPCAAPRVGDGDVARAVLGLCAR
jgi:hypothetical protein